MRLRSRLIAATVIVSVANVSMAGSQSYVRMALDLQPYKKGDICSAAKATFGCDATGQDSCLDVDGTADGTPYFMYIVILDWAVDLGITGAALGLIYETNQVQIGGYSLCEADREDATPEWPASDTGTVFIWDSCQNTPDPGDFGGEGAAVAAGLYVWSYAPDTVHIFAKPRAGTSGLLVVDCSSDTTDLTIFPDYPNNVGTVGFGNDAGFDPCTVLHGFPVGNDCDIVAVRPSTWGGIKSQYGDKP